MEEARPLLQFLNKFLPLSEEEFKEYILPVLKVRTFGKKQAIIDIGEVENYVNFISAGLVRKYYKRGELEVHTQISHEGQIILVQDSFLSRQPSDYRLETIEDTTLLSITFEDLERLYSTSPRMEHLGRIIVTNIAVMQDKWQAKLIKLSPRERFIDFVKKNPKLIQRVPQKYLACLLNIKPETFSRFKHLLRSKS